MAAPPPFDTALLDTLMAAADLDLLLVTSKHNVSYMLGGHRALFFDYMDAMGVSRYVPVVVYARGAAAQTGYIGHRTEIAQAQNAPFWMAGAQTSSWGSVDAIEKAVAYARQQGFAMRRIGIEAAFLPFDSGQALVRLTPGSELVDTLDLLERLRMRKSPQELAMLRTASEQVAEAMLEVFAGCAPGMTKRDLTEQLRQRETDRGLTFEYCLIAAGNSHNRAPSGQVIAAGDVINLDSGANKHGYIGDIARMGIVYSIQSVGLVEFYRSFMTDVHQTPVLLAPATSHYSWPKAATLLGLGSNAVIIQRVDRDARLDLEHVEATLMDLRRRRVPLLAAVAVIGSTEESAVDPLAGLLALRDHARDRGQNFVVHADAAWGGYFRAMLRPAGVESDGEPDERSVPTFAMSPYVQRQYRVLGHADSITVDPHKAGYIPYPAGALCYRNAAMRDAISLQAPVVFHSQAEPTVGIYGVEGSKPGSAAAAVWLAHRVIRPDRSGYGRILGQCMWTSKRLFCRLHTLDDPRFRVTLFNATPAERARRPDDELAAERAAIARMTELDNTALEALLASDPAAQALFTALGSDQVILAFSLNFRTPDGRMNKELARANAFNERVFSHCSLVEPREDVSDLDLLLTSSRFEPRIYGHPFVDAFCRRLGVVPQAELGVDFLISTTMDPWTTETERGDFLGVVVRALQRAAHRALDELAFN